MGCRRCWVGLPASRNERTGLQSRTNRGDGDGGRKREPDVTATVALTAEQTARREIDAALMAAGWVVQDAKAEGETLTGVEPQAERYSAGLPEMVPAHCRP